MAKSTLLELLVQGLLVEYLRLGGSGGMRRFEGV